LKALEILFPVLILIKHGKEIISFIGGLVKEIWDFFKSLPEKLLDIGKEMISSLLHGLESAPGAVISAFKKLISVDLGFVGKALEIFGAAEGGIVNAPTLLIAGEAGPEAIIPLSKLQSKASDVHPLAPGEQIGASGGATASAVTSGLHISEVNINGAGMTNAQVVNELYLKLRPLLTSAA